MYKIKDTKKAIKQTMVMCAIATMLLVSLGLLTTLKTVSAASVTPRDINPIACAECFTSVLNPIQLANVKALSGLNIDSSNDDLCNAVKQMTASRLHSIITQVGAPSYAADSIIQCLISTGFTNLST